MQCLVYEGEYPFKLGTAGGETRTINCCDDLRAYFIREFNINPYDFPFGKETKEMLSD